MRSVQRIPGKVRAEAGVGGASGQGEAAGDVRPTLGCPRLIQEAAAGPGVPGSIPGPARASVQGGLSRRDRARGPPGRGGHARTPSSSDRLLSRETCFVWKNPGRQVCAAPRAAGGARTPGHGPARPPWGPAGPPTQAWPLGLPSTGVRPVPPQGPGGQAWAPILGGEFWQACEEKLWWGPCQEGERGCWWGWPHFQHSSGSPGQCGEAGRASVPEAVGSLSEDRGPPPPGGLGVSGRPGLPGSPSLVAAGPVGLAVAWT